MDIWMGGYITVRVNGVEVNSVPQGEQRGLFYGLENRDAGSSIYFRSLTFEPNFN
jgi:hypothetical protein